jgi:carboxyvinyl-carboxyphosphonate phosphorylmutase
VVDADHGYGNAMNTRRTIEELEAAGVAGLTIEDTVLPRPYGGGPNTLTSVEEFRDRLRGAVDARIDPSFVIIGRTAIREDAETLARARACAEAGVDAIFLQGRCSLALVEAVHEATGLPLVANRAEGTNEELYARGVRVKYLGHQPYYVALKALYEAYVTLKNGGSAADLAPRVIQGEARAAAFADEAYTRARSEYLRDEMKLNAPE